MHVRIAWEIYNHQQKAKAESRLPGAVAGPPPHPRTGFDPLGAGASRTGFDPLGAGAKPPGAPDYKRPDLLYGGGGPLGRLGGPPAPNPCEPGRSPYGAAVAARGFYGPSPLGMFPILSTSVADPDPHVFEPPGSGSISQRYGPDPDPSITKQKNKKKP